jgi:hypothetical protein
MNTLAHPASLVSHNTTGGGQPHPASLVPSNPLNDTGQTDSNGVPVAAQRPAGQTVDSI